MRLAGPLTDNAGGAVLLVVSDEAEAKAIVANDPACTTLESLYTKCILGNCSRGKSLPRKLKMPRNRSFHPSGYEFMKQFREL